MDDSYKGFLDQASNSKDIMTSINWHNPARVTPLNGYRLLIPEEVDGRFKNTRIVRIWSRATRWKPASTLAEINNLGVTYSVPIETPLPDGYALINGQVWQLNGWTPHNPGDKAPVDDLITIPIEVQYRSGERRTALAKQHQFGTFSMIPYAEIIAWRIVPEIDNQSAEHRMNAAIQQLRQQLEDIKSVLDENQRLKSQLADAHAIIDAIRLLLPPTR
jgi:hypothetical protein